METAPTVLEYDVTPEDVWRDARRARHELRRRWTQRLGALVYLLIILEVARSGAWLAAAGCAVLFASWWFGWVYWLVFRFFAAQYRMRIEVDDQGLLLSTSPARSRQRIWWRRLTGVRDLPDAVELDVDGDIVLRIPHDAFASVDDRARFHASVNDHRASRREVAAAR